MKVKNLIIEVTPVQNTIDHETQNYISELESENRGLHASLYAIRKSYNKMKDELNFYKRMASINGSVIKAQGNIDDKREEIENDDRR